MPPVAKGFRSWKPTMLLDCCSSRSGAAVCRHGLVQPSFFSLGDAFQLGKSAWWDASVFCACKHYNADRGKSKTVGRIVFLRSVPLGAVGLTSRFAAGRLRCVFFRFVLAANRRPLYLNEKMYYPEDLFQPEPLSPRLRRIAWIPRTSNISVNF